jgi:rhodanese-related sulfurtransferase
MSIQRLDSKVAFDTLTGSSNAVLLDVRDPVEFSFVGHPIGAVNVPLRFAPDMHVNPNFVDQVRATIPDRSTPIFILCRSGQRSLAAASLLEEAGYDNLANIDDGFEGGIDENKHRGTISGWRFNQLPWVQS